MSKAVNWSFAVLEARRVTEVTPVNVDVECDEELPPQPAVKKAAKATDPANRMQDGRIAREAKRRLINLPFQARVASTICRAVRA
jgi:hypothetical protein